MTPEQIEKLYLAASQCETNGIVSEWQKNATLRKRIEKLEKLLVASKALDKRLSDGDDFFKELDAWRAALAELEQP